MTRENILIVGGYGEVGSKIATLLLSSYPNRVCIAGRNLEKAKQFCAQHHDLAKPIQMDVSKTVPSQQLANVALVIMCLEQKNTSFAHLCLKEGIKYIDITASYAFLKKLEDLHLIAEQNHSTAVFSVGMAPGLTNLMAMHAAQQLSSIEKLHISILLGAGDTHGTAAILWILQQLNIPYYTYRNRKVANFTKKRIVQFKGIGKRSVYQFNFSDQHTLTRHYSHIPIETRLGFDVESLNRYVSFLQKSRIAYLLKFNKAQTTLASIIQKTKIGSDVCAIKIEAIGTKHHKDTTVIVDFIDHDESLVTAKVAASIATQLLENKYPSGTYHIEDLFTFESLQQQFETSSFSKSFMP
ncbi:saccharopine dehydrogenase NADP-binding domain-containing protein [Lysinibacillus cavernae]|uniref:saccharopine dehydrogenase NADP-binding domain-containing protein n=1 Tax=Lysinibacillus cavernae TaxID=2666135 RepID=UPI0012D8A703|nr:saccharopine dehydrogenase NADP-binding domain-containing protein [Lysinibacillus cavernae]